MSINTNSIPPVAKRIPSERQFHNDTFIDHYEWLRDRENPEVINYLEAENAYHEEVTAPLKDFETQIVAEIKSRTKEDSANVAVKRGNWWYWSALKEGQQYAIYYRCPVESSPQRPQPVCDLSAAPAGTQLVCDGNALAEGKEFFSLGSLEVNDQEDKVALSVDFTGGERYEVLVYEISSGQLLDSSVHECTTSVFWDASGQYLFYGTSNEAWRNNQVWRHELGTTQTEDQLICQEDDDSFNLFPEFVTADKNFLVISSFSTLTSEIRLLDRHAPLSDPWIVCPRKNGLMYEVASAGDHLVILHNANCPDFELATAPIGSSSPDIWCSILKTKPGERLNGVAAYKHGLLVSLRSNALPALLVLPRCTKEKPEFEVSQISAVGSEPVAENNATEIYSYGEPWSITGVELGGVELRQAPQWEDNSCLIAFESLVCPLTVGEVDLEARTQKEIWKLEVPNFNVADYITWREWATAPDGTQVPLTLARHRKVEKGANPGFLYGYGSYEVSCDPYFSVPVLSLLDRGVIYAMAHIRGGGELGRSWYENGKMLSKRNTFTDFIAAADHLFAAGWVDPARLAAEGRSAGGLLMGAVTNIGTDRFRVIHAGVPFVDALTTILNPDLPLTVGEWEEWGNPLADPEVYQYMKTYSPYENIRPEVYPAILATTSLNDIRVFYVEPAKWVAQLRHTILNDATRPVLLHCEMVAGHGGKSGRYNKWVERAQELAFMLDQIGVGQETICVKE